MGQSELIVLLRALAHPTRLGIVELLVQAPQGMSAGAIASALNVRQNTLSSHIAVLLRSGLIDGRRDGRTINYAMDTDSARRMLGRLHLVLGEKPRK